MKTSLNPIPSNMPQMSDKICKRAHAEKVFFQQYSLVVMYTSSVMRETHNHGKGINTHTKILSLLKTGVLQWVSYHSEGALRQIYQQINHRISCLLSSYSTKPFLNFSSNSTYTQTKTKKRFSILTLCYIFIIYIWSLNLCNVITQ